MDISGVFMDDSAWRLWCPKQIPGLGQPSRLLGRQWLKSPTAWWWASGTHLHFSQIAWLITVLSPGTVYVLNLMIHQTFLRKVSHKCVRIHLDSRVGDAFWFTSVRKPVGKNVDLGICFRSHLCTLLVIYLLHVAHFPVRIIWKPVSKFRIAVMTLTNIVCVCVNVRRYLYKVLLAL